MPHFFCLDGLCSQPPETRGGAEAEDDGTHQRDRKPNGRPLRGGVEERTALGVRPASPKWGGGGSGMGWCGSIHEQAGEEGMAHLHEHMLFKRTENLAPGDLDRRVAELGGEVNAWTSYDETVYHLLLPASAYDEGLRLLREMVMNALF